MHCLQELVNAYRGGDPDKQMQRHAAAKYVGLTIPESVPLGRTPLHIAEQYDLSNKLKAMAEGNDLSKLSGLDNIKAQVRLIACVHSMHTARRQCAQAPHSHAHPLIVYCSTTA